MPVSGNAPTPKSIQRYGWIPDLPDPRDVMYEAPVGRALPARVDLRKHCPPVYDQGQLGSCTANAVGAAMQFTEIEEHEPHPMPSRLFIYYNERVIENSVNTDSGAQIRDGIKSVAGLGVCPESEWPYVIAKFAEQPIQKCYSDARKTRAITYSRIAQNATQLKSCLAAGFPFVFGFTVFTEFESQRMAESGVGRLPAKGDRPIGGHAVMAVGYDDDDAGGTFLIRNSWGAAWGLDGYFTFPYAYLLDDRLSADFWTIRKVSP